MFQEFGPQRRVPRDLRLKSEFPSLDEREIGDLIERFRRIEDTALRIAERAVSRQITESDGRAQLKSECPMLSDELVESTFSQAFFFAYK